MKRKTRYIIAGYLVEDTKVFLVHHKKQNKWVPPGGHVKRDETPSMTLIREFKEEVKMDIEVLDAGKEKVFKSQSFWKNQPRPFFVDLEDMRASGYDHDLFVEFFFVKRKNKKDKITHQKKELHDFGWFGLKDLEKLNTYIQVKTISKYAIKNFPK